MSDECSDIRKKTPEEVVSAIVAPAPLTIAKIAILEGAGSPILNQNVRSLRDNVKSVYLVNLKYSEAAKKIKSYSSVEFEEEAMEWADKLGWVEYDKLFTELVEGLIAFWKMLPPSEEKKTEENQTD